MRGSGEIDIIDTYNRVLAGYEKLFGALMGRAPISSLGKGARVLWEPMTSRASGDVLQIDIGKRHDQLWQLVSYSLVEGRFKVGRGFSTPHYLAFLFFVERWLRSLNAADASQLADMAFYYRRWDGRTLYEQRFTRANGGLDSVVTLGVFGHGSTLARLGGSEGTPQVTPEDPWSVLPMLHPALYQAMLVEWQSDQDDPGVVTPWAQWARLFRKIKIPPWMPLVVGVSSIKNWTGLDLSGAILRGADLYEADLSHASLRDTDLGNADLRSADLTMADLAGANLDKADLYEANLTKANLTKANLYEANLRGADLTKAKLIEADLANANLVSADLVGADLTGANLAEANVYYADFTGAKGLEIALATLTRIR